MSACTTVIAPPLGSDVAEVAYVELTFDENGNAVVSASGDEDAADLYVTVGDGTDPADPTVATNDGTISGRGGTVSTGVKITTGKDAHVKVVAADSEGVLGPVQSAKQARRIGPFHKDTTTRSHTGDTTETTLETITIPANILGSNGGVRIRGHFVFTGASGTSTVRVRFGGTLLAVASVLSLNETMSFDGVIFNDGATNAQRSSITFWANNSDANHVNSPTSAIDTTADADITITARVGDSTDQIDLSLSYLELIGTD